MRLMGEGRQAEVYDIGDGKCLKLFFKDYPEDWARNEARNTSLAWERGLSAPRCYGVETHMGRIGIVMEALTGETMLKEALTHPKDGVDYGYLLGAEHKKLNAISGEGFSDMTDSILWAISKTDMLAEADKQKLCEITKSLPRENRLVHFDFHPENVFMTKDGPRIIDWTSAYSGNPLADAAHTTLINEAPVFPVNADEETIRVITEMKKQFSVSYFEGYGIKREDLGAWLPIIAASRLYGGAPAGELEYDYDIVKEYLSTL